MCKHLQSGITTKFETYISELKPILRALFGDQNLDIYLFFEAISVDKY
jgi:hypothetical protein